MLFKKKSAKKRGFRSVFSLLCWWKSRHFYFPQVEEADDGPTTSNENRSTQGSVEHKAMAQPECAPSRSQKMAMLKNLPPPPEYPIERSTTIDSFQPSIESMDSLAESYWDPEDETSQVTALVSNRGGHPDFLGEHLSFLSAQTQPREVEVVYRESYVAQ